MCVRVKMLDLNNSCADCDQMCSGKEDDADYLCVKVTGKEDEHIPFSLSFKDGTGDKSYKLYGMNIDCPSYFGGVAYDDKKLTISQIIKVYWSSSTEEEDVAEVLIGGFIIDHDIENAESELNMLVYDLFPAKLPHRKGRRHKGEFFMSKNICFSCPKHLQMVGVWNPCAKFLKY